MASDNGVQIVYTPLGKGKVVYQLPDGTLVVEFEHGGGYIFRPEELFRTVKPKRVVAHVDGQHRRVPG